MTHDSVTVPVEHIHNKYVFLTLHTIEARIERRILSTSQISEDEYENMVLESISETESRL